LGYLVGKEKNILIIEDDKIISVVLQTYLKKLGFNVIDSVTTGEDAIEIAKKTKPDIILSDIMLDGILNGIEAVKEITRHIKTDIIYMTSHTDPKYKKMAAETNYIDFLHKPVTFDTLQKTLTY